MPALVECRSCKGLRHPNGTPCPHCGRRSLLHLRGLRWLLALFGVGTVTVSCFQVAVPYGLPDCPGCTEVVRDAGADAGLQDAGPADGGSPDGGPTDGGEADG
jgi:hypothetical protein